MRPDEEAAFEALKKSLGIVRKKSELDRLVQKSIAHLVERSVETLSAAGKLDDVREIAKAAGVAIDMVDANGKPREAIDIMRDILRGPGQPVFPGVLRELDLNVDSEDASGYVQDHGDLSGQNNIPKSPNSRKSAPLGSIRGFEKLIADSASTTVTKSRAGGALRK